MKYLKNRRIFRLYEHILPFLNYSISLESKLPEKKVLLIAANEGDEVIGCAGTILKHIGAGGSVETLYCCQNNSVELKKAEKIGSMLGSNVKHFMPFTPNKLGDGDKFAEALMRLLLRVNPKIVFVPFMLDADSDNRAISKTLAKIARKIDLDFMIAAYSVWMPAMPNCIFDISPVWEKKKEILKFCNSSSSKETKVISKDFLKIAEGICQYWGQLKSPDIKYAEAFFMTTAKSYIKLVKKVF